MKLASEKNLNKFAFPLFNIKGRTIEHPCRVRCNGVDFICDQGTFGSRNMMVLDILGTYMIHHSYNMKNRDEADFGDRIPTMNDSRVKGISSDYTSYKLVKFLRRRFQSPSADGIVPESFYSDEGYLHNVDHDNSRVKKVITVKINDSYLKDQLPFLNKYSSKQIWDMIRQTSECRLRMYYPIRYYDGKNFQNFPYNNFNENGSCSFFTLLNVNDSGVSKDGHILAREYEISFNTFLGYFFIQNCISCYTDLLPGKFYEMSDYAQLFYRHLILPYYGKVKNPVSVEEIKKRLVLKTPDTYMVRKTIQRILEELKSNSFIRDPKQEKLRGKYWVSYTKIPWKEIEK